MGDTAAQVAVVALFAIGPVLLVMLTSFVKVSVVLAVLRNGLGAGDVPSGLVLTGLSLVLTLFIMAPVVDEVVGAIAPAKAARPRGPAAPAPGAPAPGTGAEWVNRDWPEGAVGWVAAADRAAVPVRAFLAKHAHRRDRDTFVGLASRLRDGRAVAFDNQRRLMPRAETDLVVGTGCN